MSLHPFQEFWREWAQVPLKHEALEAAQQWLIDRQTGTNLAWIPSIAPLSAILASSQDGG